MTEGYKPVRIKWEFDTKRFEAKRPKGDQTNKTKILDLIDNDLLTVHFQPILSLSSPSVFGYEALARVKQQEYFPSVVDMFNAARECGLLTNLDIACCSNALKESVLRGIVETGCHLFINLSPDTICDSSYSIGITNEIVNGWGIERQRVVFEITEESVVEDLEKFLKIINMYKEAGYKIAIDDFGTGYGGLKMLSIVEPDFIKIDRHFISNIDKAIMKYNLVDSIVIACHRMGISIVAEGIERQEELEVVMNMGIDYAQGYYLCKPQPSLKFDDSILDSIRQRTQRNEQNKDLSAEAKFIGDIAVKMPYISPDTPVKSVLNRLIDDPNLRCQPVVDNDRIVGMIYRTRFIENQVVGKCGYGMHLNYHKKIKQVMETRFLTVEANEPLETVSQKVQKRRPEHLYDEIAVTKNGKYHGIVPINVLLDAITQKSLLLAKGANPLTGLPGNEAIQREIEKRINQSIHFDVAYFDLNNFKPYNDYYGFERGDYVIKTLGNILLEVTQKSTRGSAFVGHIGGDDFILICHPSVSLDLCNKVIVHFEQKQVEFHGTEDYKAGYFKAKNRKGEEETFGLLSVSVAIVSTEVYKIDSFAELASIATEVKKAAKAKSTELGRSAIVRDRRLHG